MGKAEPTSNQTKSNKRRSSSRRKENRIRKCSYKWTYEATTILIENVKKMTNLWNPSEILYKDRKLHKESWERIAKTLRLPKQEVVVRWNSLRSNYRMHHKNRRDIINGKATKYNRTTHPFFLAMSFMDPVFEKLLNYSSGDKSNTSQLGEENKKDDGSDLDVEELFNLSDIKEEKMSDTSEDESEQSTQDKLRSSMLPCKIVLRRETTQKKSEEPKENTRKDDHVVEEVSEPLEDNQVVEEEVSEPLEDDHVVEEEVSEPLRDDHVVEEEVSEPLEKKKLRLEIYNLQLDAMRKEIDLGLARSQLTAELYNNVSRRKDSTLTN